MPLRRTWGDDFAFRAVIVSLSTCGPFEDIRQLDGVVVEDLDWALCAPIQWVVLKSVTLCCRRNSFWCEEQFLREVERACFSIGFGGDSAFPVQFL